MRWFDRLIGAVETDEMLGDSARCTNRCDGPWIEVRAPHRVYSICSRSAPTVPYGVSTFPERSDSVNGEQNFLHFAQEIFRTVWVRVTRPSDVLGATSTDAWAAAPVSDSECSHASAVVPASGGAGRSRTSLIELRDAPKRVNSTMNSCFLPSTAHWHTPMIVVDPSREREPVVNWSKRADASANGARSAHERDDERVLRGASLAVGA